MSTSAEYDRGWELTRALAFVAVCVIEGSLFLLNVLVSSVGVAAVLFSLGPLHDRLRPPAPIDPTTDLRAFYRAAV